MFGSNDSRTKETKKEKRTNDCCSHIRDVFVDGDHDGTKESTKIRRTEISRIFDLLKEELSEFKDLVVACADICVWTLREINLKAVVLTLQ